MNGATTSVRRNLARFWSREASLTALLAFLVLTIFFLGPLTASSGRAHILTEIGFALGLVAGVFAVSRGGWFSWSFATLVLGRLTFYSLVRFNPDRRLAAIDVAWILVLLCMLIPAVMAEVFRAGPITM